MAGIKVSFVVPVFNVEQYVAECLHSILMQSLREIEILVIDDGTRDGSMEIVRSLQKERSDIRIIEQTNQGISAARNAGLREAVGEYVCFMDSDDFYSLDFAANFYEQCKQNNLDILRGWYGIYDEGDKSYLPHPFPRIDYQNQMLSGREFLRRSVSKKANEVVPWLGFFRREYLLRNGVSFPEGIGYEEDHLFFLQALLCDPCCKVMQSDMEFYAYRKRSGSATKTPTLKQVQDILAVVNAEFALIDEQKQLSDPEKRAARCYASASFYQLTSIYGRLKADEKQCAAAMVPMGIKWKCIRSPFDRHQQLKILLFTYARWVVDIVYQVRRLL